MTDDTTPAPPAPSTSGEPGVGLRAAVDSVLVCPHGPRHYYAADATCQRCEMPSWVEALVRTSLAASEADRAGGERERCACGRMTLATTVSERHDRGLHGPDRCIGGLTAWDHKMRPAAPPTADVGLTDEVESLLCLCHEAVCPVHNEAAGRVAEYDVPSLMAAITAAILAARMSARADEYGRGERG